MAPKKKSGKKTVTVTEVDGEIEVDLTDGDIPNNNLFAGASTGEAVDELTSAMAKTSVSGRKKLVQESDMDEDSSSSDEDEYTCEGCDKTYRDQARLLKHQVKCAAFTTMQARKLQQKKAKPKSKIVQQFETWTNVGGATSIPPREVDETDNKCYACRLGCETSVGLPRTFRSKKTYMAHILEDHADQVRITIETPPNAETGTNGTRHIIQQASLMDKFGR